MRTYVPSTHANPNSPRPPTLPPSLVDSLQSRSLTERDYELLLQLDSQADSGETRPRARPDRSQRQGLPDWAINAFHVEPVDSSSDLLQNGGAVCEICSLSYRRGDWVRKLPCKHKVATYGLHAWHTNSQQLVGLRPHSIHETYQLSLPRYVMHFHSCSSPCYFFALSRIVPQGLHRPLAPFRSLHLPHRWTPSLHPAREETSALSEGPPHWPLPLLVPGGPEDGGSPDPRHEQ